MIKSRDIWFNSFLLYKGYKVSSFETDYNNRVICHFEVSEEEWKKMKLEYQNSEIARYKGFFDQVKELSWGVKNGK